MTIVSDVEIRLAYHARRSGKVGGSKHGETIGGVAMWKELKWALWTAALVAGLSVGVADAAEMKVTLLGTGSPQPSLSRFGASTLIEAGAEKLIFDLGRGSSIRLFQKQIPLGAITAHFITHLHSDHVVGLPDMWLTGWLSAPFGSRKSPMVIFGPAGTVAMTENLTKAFADDIRIRSDDTHLPAAGVAFAATDIAPGLVYDSNAVKVTAIEVNHGEKIKPAFGFVIEFDGKKVVLSGDTKYDERVANAAKGADLLIHEVAIVEQTNPSFRDVEDRHTSPEDAGRIFSIAKPKLAVFSHVIVDRLDALTKPTETTYKGPFVIGQDLMSFVITDRVQLLGPNGEELKPLMAE
jgi:ribonuclease Z